MSKPIWHSGPPPSCGWWPASTCRDISYLRWWDGKVWSLASFPDEGSARAARWAGIPSQFQSDIKWRDRPKSWPERSSPVDWDDPYVAEARQIWQAATMAERKRCALVCELAAQNFGGVAEGPFVTDFGRHTHQSMAAGALNCAAAIRQGGAL